jgi:hypothetical protein
MSESPKLRREVEPPQRANSCLGVLLVASMAMFFAVASSAFILRARMLQYPDAHVPIPVPMVAPTAPTEISCGTTHRFDNGDGTESIMYFTCPPRAEHEHDSAAPAATRLPNDLKLAVPGR